MGLPPANLVLFFLSAFVGLWGVSVVVRGLRAGVVPGSRRCPACETDMREVAGRRCPACEFEAQGEAELQQRRRDFRVVIVGAVAMAAGSGLVPVGLWVRAWETTGDDSNFGMHPLHAVFWGVVVFGVVLAAWGARGERSKGRRRCPKCWYDMSATLRRTGEQAVAELRCPECGHAPPGERALYRSRRQPRLMVLGCVLVMIGLYGQTVPRALRVGPVGLVPTTVLIGGMRWLPEAWYVDPGGVNRATLDARVRQGEVWEWQLRWAKTSASSVIQNHILSSHPQAVSAVLDTRVDEDCAVVIVGLARLLGNRDHKITALQADMLRQGYSEYIPWEGGFEEQVTARRVEEALREASAGLLYRAATSGETEAMLALQLLGVLEDPPPAIVSVLEICIQSGGQARRYKASQMLGRVANSIPEAQAVIESLLVAETSRDRLAGVRAAWKGLFGSQAERWGEVLVEVVKTDKDREVVFMASAALAQLGQDHKFVSSILTQKNWSFSTRAGLAHSWAFSPGIDAEKVIPLMLPVLASDEPSEVYSVLLFLQGAIWANDDFVEEIAVAVTPLLEHKPAYVSKEAAELLETLQYLYPEIAGVTEMTPASSDHKAGVDLSTTESNGP